MGNSSDRKWQENIYWSRFQCICFCSRLTVSFREQLAIPRKFASKLRRKLPDIVVLRGPSGAAWTIELSRYGDRLFFKKGWPEFVKDHSLEERDLLIFKFNGESSFDVMIFDTSTLCEKEVLYFVQRGGEGTLERKNQTKRKTKETCVEIESSTGDDGSECASSVEKTGNQDDSFITPSENSASDDSTYVPSCNFSEYHASSKKIRKEVTDTSPAQNIGAKTKSTPRLDETSGGKFKYPSDNEALKAAMAAANSTPDSELVVMKPRHVDKLFRVGMRRRWVAKHVNPETKELILYSEGKDWLIGFYFNKANKTGELVGWKRFAIANNLKEFDVCVFTPAGRSEDVL
ncbi:hypothetical protein DITRI_Ditri03aG0199500 [Diplodiscus trichospermus]